MNVLDTLGLFAAAALAAPIALLGVDFLTGGRPLVGGAFLAVGLGALAGLYFRPSAAGAVGDRVIAAIHPSTPEDEADVE